MNNETKLLIAILVGTVIIIFGGTWVFTKLNGGAAGLTASAEDLVKSDDPVLGPNNAKVTVVEFGDFQCPACGALHPVLKQVKENNKDKSVRFVWRNFPLPQHDLAEPAAEAALAAQAQNKFWEYHDILFANQPRFDRASLEGYAAVLQLNMDQFKQDLDSGKYKGAVAQDKSDGTRLGVNSTPTIFINGHQYLGQYNVKDFQAAIDAELNK
jgi:protein-disulfide isomerase